MGNVLSIILITAGSMLIDVASGSDEFVIIDDVRAGVPDELGLLVYPALDHDMYSYWTPCATKESGDLTLGDWVLQPVWMTGDLKPACQYLPLADLEGKAFLYRRRFITSKAGKGLGDSVEEASQHIRTFLEPTDGLTKAWIDSLTKAVTEGHAPVFIGPNFKFNPRKPMAVKDAAKDKAAMQKVLKEHGLQALVK